MNIWVEIRKYLDEKSYISQTLKQISQKCTPISYFFSVGTCGYLLLCVHQLKAQTFGSRKRTGRNRDVYQFFSCTFTLFTSTPTDVRLFLFSLIVYMTQITSNDIAGRVVK